MEHNNDYPPLPPNRRTSVPGPNPHEAIITTPAYRGLREAGAQARAGGCFAPLARLLLALTAVFGLVLCMGALVGAVAYLAIAATLPSADQLSSVHLDQSTKIYDRYGGLLFEIFDPQGGRRTVIPPEQVPLVLKQATISTEDQTFYSNPGVDVKGIARAIYYDWRYHSTVVGGSTITQQLVKNTLLTPEPTFQRKMREAILALEVTRRFSKDQILAFYLNTIYYGNLSYGIQAASQSYFKKDVGQLDLAEASLLAGIPQEPSRYDPCLDPDAALERQKTVLDLMMKQGYVSADQADAAETEASNLVHSDEFGKNCSNGSVMKSPHFVEYVRQQLEHDYGPEVVYKGGLQVHTSLDPAIQSIAEEEARKQVATLKANDVSSAAVVVANPQTGEILAMVGSVDFNDKSIDGQVNVATSLRQPGSSIKPVNYVTAFEKGWTPATPLLDISTPFSNGSSAPYVPVDYDGKEHGVVYARIALANSLNIPAVKTLYFATVPEMINTAQRMGITTFTDPSRYGLSLTLGGGEVKLVELAGAYATFANQGERAPLKPYLKISDGRGQTIFDISQNQTKEQVIDAAHAYLITSILSDNNARVMEFGPHSPLELDRPAAAKTGTTDDFRDNWTVGYTPELVVGVWAGNPRNEPMKNVSGISGAAPIWHNVMERVYHEVAPFNGIAAHDFAVPSGLVRAVVCNESGLIPTDLCPLNHRRSEVFVANQAPTARDNLWVKVQVDKTNGLLANDRCPKDIVEEKVFQKMPQDVVLPYDKVVAWANAHGIPQPPTKLSPCAGGTPEGTGTPGTVTPTATMGTATPEGTNTPTATGTPLSTRTPLPTPTSPSSTPTEPPPTPTFPGPTPTVQAGKTVIQDNNPAVQYIGNWLIHYDQRAWGGTYHDSSDTGGTASVAVSSAHGFQVVTVRGPNRGIANILVDGNIVGTFDEYGPADQFMVLSPVYSLPDTGEHVIAIQVSGKKNPLSGGYSVVLDAYVVYGGPR